MDGTLIILSDTQPNGLARVTVFDHKQVSQYERNISLQDFRTYTHLFGVVRLYEELPYFENLYKAKNAKINGTYIYPFTDSGRAVKDKALNLKRAIISLKEFKNS